MYKMTLKYKELELAIESTTPIVNDIETYQAFMVSAVSKLDKEQHPTGEATKMIENNSTIHYNKQEVQQEKPVIRDRLPNRSSVVDLAQLSVETSKGTAHSHFRCPNCAQSSVLIANGMPVVRDIINEDACFSVDFDVNGSEKLTYEKACENTLEQVRFTVGDEMYSTCPACDATYPTEEFVKAYHHPLDYFESEHPCPMCGESLWLTNENNKTYLACEEPCIFKKEVQRD